MGYARRQQVSLSDTPYYHITVRCVRRAWLWGVDDYLGRDYSHRKGWVLDRLKSLVDIFSLDVCAYAIMSNHYHLVLHVDRKRAAAWQPLEIVNRWERLFSLPPFIKQWQQGQASAGEAAATLVMLEEWRGRLSDVSWFMRSLNENLARRANAEDSCTGRFWEGRFKCRALIDEVQLLTAMAYVDLNPVRAGIAQTPETSEFTSVHARIRAWKQPGGEDFPVRLMRFRGQVVKGEAALPLRFIDYLQLVDWTGRLLRLDKFGAIPADAPPILQRLGIDPQLWGKQCQGIERRRRRGTGKGPIGHPS